MFLSHSISAQEIKSSQGEIERRSLVAHRISPLVKLSVDGLIDEPIWNSVDWADGFTERTPSPRSKPQYQGGAKALFDGYNLYVAVRLDIAPGEQPSSIELRRDQTKIWSDDTVTLKLDTRLDRRTTLGLVMSCGGAQLDFLALDNGKGFYIEYDALWEGAVSISSESWFAEYRIPLSTLGLSAEASKLGQIGFNITRDHNARQATDDWQHLPPEFGPFSALHYGRLSGLDDAESGRPLIMIPYALTRLSNDRSGAILKLDEMGIAGGVPSLQAGGEFRLSLSEAEWLEATVLTDFAQVDLDDPLINLNRFPLFLPERRPYFINGLDIFSFGARGRSQPFFSRRIGLTSNGGEVPVLGGLKLYGRRGGWRYGILSALTDRGVEQGDDSPGQTFLVTRTRYDLGDGGYLGIIGMVRDGDRSQGQFETQNTHLAGGVDGRVRLIDTRLELSGFYTMTDLQETAEGETQFVEDPQFTEDTVIGQSAGLNLSWRGQNLRPTLDYLWVDERFDPLMGFVYRKDIHSIEIGSQYLFFKPSKRLRSASIGAALSSDHSSDWNINLGKSLMVTGSLCHITNMCVETGLSRSQDRVRNAFDLADIVEVQAEDYLSHSGYVTLRSPGGRRVEFSSTYTHEFGYFGGVLDQLKLTGSIALNRHVRFLTLMNWAWFEVSGRPLNQSNMGTNDDLEDVSISKVSGDSQGVSGQLIITPSANLLIDSVGQLNSDRDLLVLQSRLRYRYRPGSDVYLVYRRSGSASSILGETVSSRMATSIPNEWRVTLKLNWRFDLLL